VHERRRSVVEQLAVVDAQHEPAPGGALGQRVAGAGQQLHSRGQWTPGRRQQRRERPERDRPRRAGRPHPLDRAALSARQFRGLGREPRLADAGGPGDHDTACGTARHRLTDEPQLGVAPRERPPHVRSVIDRAPVE
jgi:hypothetical protein